MTMSDQPAFLTCAVCDGWGAIGNAGGLMGIPDTCWSCDGVGSKPNPNATKQTCSFKPGERVWWNQPDGPSGPWEVVSSDHEEVVKIVRFDGSEADALRHELEPMPKE